MGKEKTNSFTLELDLKPELYQIHILEKRFEIARKIYNACIGEIKKRYEKMTSDKEFIENLTKEKSKEKNDKFRELELRHSVSEYSLHEFVKPINQRFSDNIDSNTAQKIATRAWLALQKLRFGEAEKIYFKTFGSMDSVEGKSNRQGIRFKDGNLHWNNLILPVFIDKNDIYAEMSLENRIKFCRIRRKNIRGKVKFYLQLILEGIPPIKINKETGEFKNLIGKGKVGLDIGTQTIAICSTKEVKLLELAPEVNNIEKEKRRLLRKMDRSKRAMNPNKFNEDGSFRKDDISKWIRSNRYIKTQGKLREVHRKQATIRKLSHNKLANYILSLGDEIYVETMHFKGLQKRAKETKVSEKTGRMQRKKRFGKSLANKAPAMLLTIVHQKLKYAHNELHKIDTFSVKASQYNHIDDDYKKKKLSQRWTEFGCQRDLYSAFLLMCMRPNLKEIDKDLCDQLFEGFKSLHDIEIEKLRFSNNKKLKSMGIAN